MKLLERDQTCRRYYAVRYEPGCFRRLPWGRRRFDCGIFVHPSASYENVEQCLQEVVRHNSDWICTYGADAEAWHDRVDHASVEIGRQKRVGDGSPMTAWFDEVTRLRDLDMARCYGGFTFLLVLVGFPADLNKTVRGFDCRTGQWRSVILSVRRKPLALWAPWRPGMRKYSTLGSHAKMLLLPPDAAFNNLPNKC
jgi:hypothetical protein